MTKQELEEQLASEFPSFSPTAIECIACSTILYHGAKNELNEAIKERDALKLRQADEQTRLECLKLAAPLHPFFRSIGCEVNFSWEVQQTADKYYSYVKERKISD